MYKALILIFVTTSIYAQNTFFNKPVLSGTPLIPSNDVIEKYFAELKRTDYNSFKKITSNTALPQNVGDEYDFNVLNLEKPNSPKVEKKTFVLKVSSEKVDIWVEKKELENNHVTDAVINAIYNGLIVNTPATSINPTQGIFEIQTDVFADPPDIDGNGKVEFLLTDVIDGWDGSGGFVGGFFYPNDQNLSFPGSNKADILYVDTYPGIFNENKYSTHRALGTVAHEFQHLIHYGYDQDESDWVNEGQSELASFLCGYGLRSPDLYLQNNNHSMTSWNNEEALQHYSRVALFFYYLYEKFGLSLISQISRSSLHSVQGFNKALQNAGIGLDFDQIIYDFFKTLSSNNPQQNIEYAFNLPEMQFLKFHPKHRIINYPSKKELAINPYSMQMVEFTNGDSLSMHFEDPFFNPVFINYKGFGTKSVLNEVTSDFIDRDFGESYHTQSMYFINNSSSLDLIEFKADSKTKYDIQELQYDNGSATFSISSYNSNTLKGTTNAIQYNSPQDTVLLKSIKFYNKSTLTDLRVHLYQSELRSGINPASESVVIKNVVQSGWVSIDTEDFMLKKDKDETFNVGIEFLTDGAGAMGYDDDFSGNEHKDKSFVKGLTNRNVFSRLNEFQIGTSLTGTWMIRLEIATPYTGSDTHPYAKIESMKVRPVPFNPQKNLLTIEYELDNSNPVQLKIFNILGQLVFSKHDELGGGAFYWNGKNQQGASLASGLYIVRLSTKKSEINKRLILIR